MLASEPVPGVRGRESWIYIYLTLRWVVLFLCASGLGFAPQQRGFVPWQPGSCDLGPTCTCPIAEMARGK